MMKWYDGGIAEAVTLSRQNGSIFVVYIEGGDDTSKKCTEILEAEDVSAVLGGGGFVALKLEANSVPHQQFSEIYKQTSIPSIYFIGKTGTPLEIVTEVKDAADVLGKMNNAVIKNGGAPLNIKTEDLIKKEATREVVCDGDVCELVPKAGTSQPVKEPTPAENHIPPSANTDNIVTATTAANEAEQVGEDSSLSAEDKLKLAQDLIEKKRAQKKIEDEEAQKQKEVDRRKLGQDVQKMKRWQQEQEMKQVMEERQREKREEQEARDKVKRQIEEDKREKAARLAAAATSQQQQEPPKNYSPRPSNSHTARLQFRLPNGTSHMHDFPSTSLLQEVNEYIKGNVQVGGNFVLATTFPRREFNEEDAGRNLLELQLVPNAVLLVLPVAHGAVTTGADSGFMGMVWFVLTPIFNFLGYVKGLIFGRPTAPTTRDPVRSEGAESGPSSSRPMPKKRAGESVIRRTGNIHRLTDKDSDDENNTWNGNSTQQM